MVFDEIAWIKGNAVGKPTANGSFNSPSHPAIRREHEYIIIASKGQYKLPNPDDLPADIKSDEFDRYTRSVWHISNGGHKDNKGLAHPAPFPYDLPKRLIKLYSFQGMTVVDPFCGSGTTLVAAKRLGRNFIGIDNQPHFCDMSKNAVDAVPWPKATHGQEGSDESATKGDDSNEDADYCEFDPDSIEHTFQRKLHIADDELHRTIDDEPTPSDVEQVLI